MARYKRGATPKLNVTTLKQIVEAIRNGLSIEKAVAVSGISKDTLYRWLDSREGRYATPLIKEFKHEVGVARKEAKLINLGLLRPTERTP